MTRLPTPGGDDGNWGSILNDFLTQSHTASGSLKNNSVGTSQLQDGTVTRAKTSSAVQTSLDLADTAIPSSQKGTPSGIATLDSSSKLITSQLPGMVATVSEVPTLAFPGASIGALGDSITANGWNENQPGLQMSNASTAWLLWLVLLSQGRLRLKASSAGKFVAATGGYTSAQIVATHLPTAESAGWSYCIVTAGTNDGIDVAAGNWTTTRDNIITIASRLAAAGTIPILTTQVPKGAPTHAQTAPDVYGLTRYNNWIKQYAADNGYPLIDWYAIMADPASAGAFKYGESADNLHPNPVGAKAMGVGAWAYLQNIVPKTVVPLPVVNLQGTSEPDNIAAYAMNSNGSNALMLDGSAGVATGITVDGTGTPTISDDATVGKLQRVTTTSTAAHRAYTSRNGPTMVGGNRYLLVCEVEATVKSAGAYHELYLWPNSGSAAICGWEIGTEDIPPHSVFAAEFVCPADADGKVARIFWRSRIESGGTIAVGRLGLYDLTARGAV